MERDGVTLARRKSGGGCIYEDMGNAVFSFFHPIKSFKDSDYKTMNNELLVQALESLGIQSAEASGRNDIVIGNRKISGSAYKINLGKADGKGKKSLHHGTMMLDVDLNSVEEYLNPSKKKLISKGVESVKSRVLNLSELKAGITYESWNEALIDQFMEKHNDRDVFIKFLSIDEVTKVDKIMEIYEQLNDWEWRFGRTPDFTHNIEHKFTWALIDMNLNVKNGLITNGQVYSDSLIPEFIDRMNEVLQNPGEKLTYDEEGFTRLFNILDLKMQDNDYYEDFIKHQIEDLKAHVLNEL